MVWSSLHFCKHFHPSVYQFCPFFKRLLKSFIICSLTSLYVLALHSLNSPACLTCGDSTLWILLITLMCTCFGVLITSLGAVRQFGRAVNPGLIREAIHHSLVSAHVDFQANKSLFAHSLKRSVYVSDGQFVWSFSVILLRGNHKWIHSMKFLCNKRLRCVLVHRTSDSLSFWLIASLCYLGT